MGNISEKTTKDFHWEYTDQPHATRRIQILRKHPEVRKLMKATGDRKLALIGFFLGFVHLAIGFLSHNLFADHKPWKFFTGIAIGSWLAAWIFVSLHEAAHGILFGPCYPRLNKLYGITANIFLGIPVFSYFKRHHLDHHKYQGDHVTDVEYPTPSEVKLFNSHPITKFLWLHLNPFLQHFRTFTGAKPLTFSFEEFLNYSTVISFDLLLVYFGQGHIVGYMSFCLVIALTIGVVGAWGLSTHTVFFAHEDTLSYYGWVNPLFLNVGFHMEHHDFPNVPARLLPEISKMAPEFYEEQHHLDSLWTSIIKFVHEDRIGLHSRIKRIPSKNRQKTRGS